MVESQSIGKLLSLIKRREQIYFHRKLKGKGIGYGEVKIFKYLGENKGATQKEITQFFQLDKSSTSYLINKMLKSNYVKKETDLGDQRSQKLYLTDKGLKKFKTLKGEIFDGWTQQLLKGFSSDEKKKIFELTDRMAENVNFSSEEKNDNKLKPSLLR